MTITRRLIVGLGTGRCGTHSLAKLLSIQPETVAFHQPLPCLPWQIDEDAFAVTRRTVDEAFGQAPIVGLVGWYYLNYVDRFMDHYATTSIALRRDRAATVASVLRTTRGHDNWSATPSEPDANTTHRHLFPQFPAPDKQTAVEQYYDDYYQRVASLADRSARAVGTFDTEALNTVDGVGALLTFAGYGSEAVIRTEIREDAGAEYRWG